MEKNCHIGNRTKKIFLMILFCLSSGYPKFNVNLGFGPYHGMIAAEYGFNQERLSANIHIPYYDSDYNFIGGIGIAYHIFGINGPYFFHSSEWINGTKAKISYKIQKDKNIILEHNQININYWRMIFGLGYQHLFFTHFGSYIESGFEFYAGNGSYFTNFNQESGSLNNDKIIFPIGLGFIFSF